MNATTHENAQANGHPVFRNVGENLYRLESSGGYYALIKKGGKQFRRSLKTKDRKLAERKLKELKEKMGVLRVAQDPHGDFDSMAHRWLDSRLHRLAESTAEWYGYLIKNLAEFFGATSIRNITAENCEGWAKTRRDTAGTKAFVSELDTMNAVFQSSATPDERRAVAKAKAKYGYAWWVSQNPLEVFWGQIHEEAWLVPLERLLDAAKQAMGREVFRQELNDRDALIDEFVERIPESSLNEVRAKISARDDRGHGNDREATR